MLHGPPKRAASRHAQSKVAQQALCAVRYISTTISQVRHARSSRSASTKSANVSCTSSGWARSSSPERYLPVLTGVSHASHQALTQYPSKSEFLGAFSEIVLDVVANNSNLVGLHRSLCAEALERELEEGACRFSDDLGFGVRRSLEGSNISADAERESGRELLISRRLEVRCGVRGYEHWFLVCWRGVVQRFPRQYAEGSVQRPISEGRGVQADDDCVVRRRRGDRGKLLGRLGR